ncbi:MAG TPA: hypothetical protein VMK65_01585 [Longimicrobiales bacterium]|nr:hypothetical protein [Longimicrobiales bacterium]
MDIHGKTALILGGSGLVGMAVARRLLELAPRRLVVTALRRAEAEEAARELHASGVVPEETILEAEWGDIFLPLDLKDHGRRDVLEDAAGRARLLDDLYGDLTDEVLARSTLGEMLLRVRPDLVVDCVNTATAFAYQNVFDSASRLRAEAVEKGGASAEAVERHLATLYLPQLIRHVQISLEAMRRAGTEVFIKIGTAGTGGMGLNIPFTHSEERPSRVLLAKAGLAGAHTLYLYLMARTPGAPAVKEIKPTAAISWKRIATGPVLRAGRPVERFDASAPLPIERAFAPGVEEAWVPAGGPLEGVYLDAGENGLFSRAEFETLTALGLMEYITPEEIADNVLREVRGQPSGKDVVAALDAATSGPTYRAGVLREVALARMGELERKFGSEAIAYEMLGPPRLSKLLFEGAILARLFPGLPALAALDPDQTAGTARELVEADRELRVRMLTIGLPVLLPDGVSVLRGPDVKVRPAPGQDATDPRLVDNGWVDLRASNWERWRERARQMVAGLERLPGADEGSQADHDPAGRDGPLRPGRLAAWVLRVEDGGERVKR